MNLRRAQDYTIGLDLGTASVGWAVVDDAGDLYHFKGRPTMGARLFKGATTAEERRVKRGQRRRYDRRRQRIDKLQEIFAPEMEAVDTEFFIRLNQSRILPEDKGYRWPIFGDGELTDPEYYLRFPTIYHLRSYLVRSAEKADLRLVYLALHNIVKHRGNFLYEDAGTSLKASNANALEAVKELSDAVEEYLREVSDNLIDVDGEPLIHLDVDAVRTILEGDTRKRAEQREALQKALRPEGKDAKVWAKALSGAILGYKIEYSMLFRGVEKGEGTSFDLKNEEGFLRFGEEICPDDALRLFEAIQRTYSAYILAGLLRGAECLSEAMVTSYERHANDLKTLKTLFRDYLPKDEYDRFFRGEKDERGEYDINSLKKGTYTSFVSGERKANRKGTSHEELLKEVNRLCKAYPSILGDSRYMAIATRVEAGAEGDFLAKQKTRDNGAIPFQLHLEEMDAIIEHQKVYYPFLSEHKEELEHLVSSRIPYYVGPLYYGSDPDSRKNAWSVRKPGMEQAKAYPWNVEEVIDTDQTAELFIRRMTGTCSYLFGEPVLPRHSLLYEEFCVLNELNGSRWCKRGERPHRFDYVDKSRVFEELFKRYATVSYDRVQNWLMHENGVVDAEVSSAQGSSGFESKLTTYRDFCKILGVRNLDDACLTYDEMEEIVLWNTVFEDRGIFRRKLKEKYGPQGDGRLTDDQIRKLARKRYSGWGRLSKKLLTGLKVEASVPTGFVSIMDVLRGGNPYDHLNQMVLMEVLADKNLGFQFALDQENRRHFSESGIVLAVDELQGSPANRRAVNQAIRIIDEIVQIAGKRQPARICIEVTRDDDFSKKGRRTTSRYQKLKTVLEAFKADAELTNDLEAWKDKLDDDRLLLYFEQQGKCMYTGEALDINLLSTYHIDHIIPQSYVKDDSLSNRVLVKSATNERKLDSLLLPESIIRARSAWWKALLDAGLMSRKKHENLTCKSVSDRRLEGFIARQLVETSQVVKFVRQLCEQRYPGSEIVSVRANTSHGVRENLGLVKCRELNNIHHAHDAFLCCQVALFVGRCYPAWQDGFDLSMIRRYVKSLNGTLKAGRTPGRSGFIADRLTSSRPFVDERTGEVLWDGKERCAYIARAMEYRGCFISRMTEIATGAFWDETVYSPRDLRNGKSLAIPLKSSSRETNHEGFLDPKTYGGVSSEKQAYWFIFTAKDKRGHNKYFFEGVPIHLAERLGTELQEYADLIAVKKGCSDAVVLRKCIPLRQKFELDGTPYYLYGSTGGRNEARPAFEPVCSGELLGLVASLFQDGIEPSLTSEDCWMVYDWLAMSIRSASPKLAEMLALEKRRECFVSLDNVDKCRQLTVILKKLNSTSQTVDMSMIGGKKRSGFLLFSIASSLSSITWIDQSVTGMFEMRTTFEDLTHGL